MPEPFIISKLKIANFRSIPEAELPLENLAILIGRNNAGKSNVLAAIRLLLEGTTRDISNEDFHGQGNAHSNEITIEATLTGLTPYLDLLATQHRTKIEHCVENNSIRIQRKATRTPQLGLEKLQVWEPDKAAFGLPTGIENALKQFLPEVIYIEAFKDPTSEAQGKSTATLGKILKQIVESVRSGVADDLNKAFTQADARLNIVEKDGRAKDDRAEEIRRVESRIKGHIQRIFENTDVRLKFNFPEISDLFAAVTLKMMDHGMWTSPEMKGQGFQRVLYFALLQALAEETRDPTRQLHRPFVMLIEDPEAFLHPAMQRQIGDTLQDIADSNQVIIATHSPLVVTPERLQKVVAVRKVSLHSGLGCTRFYVPNFDTPPDSTDRQLARLLTLTNSAEFLFADHVLVVEGPSDRSLFEAVWSRRKQLRLAECHLSMVDAGTKDVLHIWCQLLRRMGIESFAVADLDFLWRAAGKVLGSDETLSSFCQEF